MSSSVVRPSQLAEAHTARLQDFLNDKLQTHADLNTIDSLIESVKVKQELLRGQLQDAHATLETANTAVTSYSKRINQELEAYRKKQAEIDKRLQIVTQSETSDDAVKKFDAVLSQVRRLDLAQGYFKTLKTFEEFSSLKVKPEAMSVGEALRPYIILRKLASELRASQPAAEDAAPHLAHAAETAAHGFWNTLKESWSAKFEKTLAKMKWPGKDLTMANGLEAEWKRGVIELLGVQAPEFADVMFEQKQGHQRPHPIVLLPLEVMVKPLELRFKYHFEGNRPTNKLDKPEFFLTHFVSLLNSFEDFFSTYLQPVLVAHFSNTEQAMTSTTMDSTSALITALLPMLRQKLKNMIGKVLKQPQLLSHLIHELMVFDENLREEWAYDGGSASQRWKGLTWELLVQHNYFNSWLEVEKTFALKRYQEIMENQDSGEIDFDSFDSGVTKPTKGALRVNDLLETITERYRPLQSFSQKLRFLIEIQIAIFDQFHERLSSSLEAYVTMTSTLARTVQGVSKSETAQLAGIGGIDRLCRVYGSAEFLERKMRDWSDDIFFLDIWDELQYRSNKSSGRNGQLGRELSLEDVASKTSSTLGNETYDGALFDETSSAYRLLHQRAERIMQETLSDGVREALQPYGRIQTWSSIAESGKDLSSLSVSSELDRTIDVLNSYLNFLGRALSTTALIRLSNHMAGTVSKHLTNHVLLSNTFSTLGAAQVKVDFQRLCSIFDRYLGRDSARELFTKLSESIDLLNLTIKSSTPNDELPDKRPGLFEVEKRLFKDNQSAREVLNELGLESLSETEARTILKLRVELGA